MLRPTLSLTLLLSILSLAPPTLAQATAPAPHTQTASAAPHDQPRWWLDRAARAAEGIAEPADRMQALLQMAMVEAATGEHDAAAATLAQAMPLFERVEPDRRRWLIWPAVELHLILEDTAGARAVAEAIPDERVRRSAIEAIERAGSRGGDDMPAEDPLVQARRRLRRPPAADGDATAGVEGAKAVVDLIEDPAVRAWTYVALVASEPAPPQWAKEMLDAAVAAAPRIDEAAERVSLLTRVALVRIGAGDTEGARAAADMAESSLAALDGQALAAAARALAYARAEAGDFDGAVGVADGIRTASDRAWALRAVAAAQARQGDRTGAAATLRSALAAARRIREPHWRDLAVRDIAVSLAEAGDLDAARAVARSLDAPDLRSETHYEVARVRAAAGDRAGSDAAAAAIEDPFWRTWVQPDVAIALTKAGDVEGATGALASIEDPAIAAAAEPAVLAARAAAGDEAAVRQALDAAEDPRQRDRTARSLAEELARARQFAQARALLEEIEDPGQRSRASSRVAQAMVEAGELEAAREVAAGVDMPWASFLYERIARAQLQAGEHESLAAWAESLEDPRRRAAILTGAAAGAAEASDARR